MYIIYVYEILYMYMEHYSVIKKNEILPFTAVWMNLKNITASEINYKDKY